MIKNKEKELEDLVEILDNLSENFKDLNKNLKSVVSTLEQTKL